MAPTPAPLSGRAAGRRVSAALRAAGATPLQARMAGVLLAVNGPANALAFVAGLRAKGLTARPPK